MQLADVNVDVDMPDIQSVIRARRFRWYGNIPPMPARKRRSGKPGWFRTIAKAKPESAKVRTRKQNITVAAMQMVERKSPLPSVVAGGHAVPALETGEHVLNPMTLLVEFPVMLRSLLATAPGWALVVEEMHFYSEA
ncbi:hypothetical protein [Rhodovulum sulfidophilum]|uniref:hypothetical protein n=1 Tax=Rhodovulum sulfidophilum TaxID=35806 RepID=UPI001F30CB98|nr:hypothetical protein [Rhodovulum sulfidophilum]MCE8440137.1 hypothetical protein [Rhodovulum sulfidophilum]MCE8469870.1 hypothetical protein [Rhodovulum sulfidophilum]